MLNRSCCMFSNTIYGQAKKFTDVNSAIVHQMIIQEIPFGHRVCLAHEEGGYSWLMQMVQVNLLTWQD